MFFAASRSPPRQWDILHSLPSIEYTAEERNRLRALNAYYQELVERVSRDQHLYYRVGIADRSLRRARRPSSSWRATRCTFGTRLA
jgi:hypothetical protein